MKITVHEAKQETALVDAIKQGLSKVEDRVAAGITAVEDGDAWLSCEISGTRDERVTSTDDPEWYYLDEYVPKPGQDKVVVPALCYYLSAYPGYYDDDGKYLGNFNLDTLEFRVDIEVDPDESDFHVVVKGNEPRPLLSLAFDANNIDYAMDSIVETILDELHKVGYSD